jgi:hypothetical protein
MRAEAGSTWRPCARVFSSTLHVNGILYEVTPDRRAGHDCTPSNTLQASDPASARRWNDASGGAHIRGDKRNELVEARRDDQSIREV